MRNLAKKILQGYLNIRINIIKTKGKIMQIQRTGCQQNFGTAQVGIIKNKKMLRKLGDLDRYFRRENIEGFRCITFSGEKVLFADGDEAAFFNEALRGQEGFAESLEEHLVSKAIYLSTINDTETVEIGGDTLDELLRKVPMIQRFGDVLAILFNPMKN